MRKVVINEYIVADPQICHGKPTINGTGIMVWQILEMLGSNMTPEEIIKEFPFLNKKHIKAALDYASSLTKEGYVVLNTQPQILS